MSIVATVQLILCMGIIHGLDAWAELLGQASLPIHPVLLSWRDQHEVGGVDDIDVLGTVGEPACVYGRLVLQVPVVCMVTYGACEQVILMSVHCALWITVAAPSTGHAVMACTFPLAFASCFPAAPQTLPVLP